MDHQLVRGRSADPPDPPPPGYRPAKGEKFLQNFISNRDGPVKVQKQGRDELPYICCMYSRYIG